MADDTPAERLAATIRAQTVLDLAALLRRTANQWAGRKTGSVPGTLAAVADVLTEAVSGKDTAGPPWLTDFGREVERMIAEETDR